MSPGGVESVFVKAGGSEAEEGLRDRRGKIQATGVSLPGLPRPRKGSHRGNKRVLGDRCRGLAQTSCCQPLLLWLQLLWRPFKLRKKQKYMPEETGGPEWRAGREREKERERMNTGSYVLRVLICFLRVRVLGEVQGRVSTEYSTALQVCPLVC